MTGTRRDQPLPRQECVGYLLNLKPGADLTAEDLARLARLDDGPFDPDQDDDPYGPGSALTLPARRLGSDVLGGAAAPAER